MRVIALFAILLMSLGGCKLVGEMTDGQLADNAYRGAKLVTSNGLKIAMNESPDNAAAIKENAKLAGRVLRENILPVFEGAGTGEVLRGAVDTALKELGDKVNPTLGAVINLAISLVADKVELPANPADKLDERTRLALVGLFKGLADGIDEAVAEPVPAPAPAPAPAPEPAPEPAPAPEQPPMLAWPKK